MQQEQAKICLLNLHDDMSVNILRFLPARALSYFSQCSRHCHTLITKYRAILQPLQSIVNVALICGDNSMNTKPNILFGDSNSATKDFYEYDQFIDGTRITFRLYENKVFSYWDAVLMLISPGVDETNIINVGIPKTLGLSKNLPIAIMKISDEPHVDLLDQKLTDILNHLNQQFITASFLYALPNNYTNRKSITQMFEMLYHEAHNNLQWQQVQSEESVKEFYNRNNIPEKERNSPSVILDYLLDDCCDFNQIMVPLVPSYQCYQWDCPIRFSKYILYSQAPSIQGPNPLDLFNKLGWTNMSNAKRIELTTKWFSWAEQYFRYEKGSTFILTKKLSSYNVHDPYYMHYQSKYFKYFGGIDKYLPCKATISATTIDIHFITAVVDDYNRQITIMKTVFQIPYRENDSKVAVMNLKVTEKVSTRNLATRIMCCFCCCGLLDPYWRILEHIGH
jgi:hypothetical protein